MARSHVEVKHRKSMGVFRFLDQARADKGEGQYELLLLHENNSPWMVAIPLGRIEEFVDDFNQNRAAAD